MCSPQWCNSLESWNCLRCSTSKTSAEIAFQEESSWLTAVQERINHVASACRVAGIVVIPKGSESATLHKGLVAEAGDALLEKPRFGLTRPDLELILRSCGIDSVIGIATFLLAKQQRERLQSVTFMCFS